MPTPGGLLKAGDKLAHKSMPGVVFVVQTRTGNDRNYAAYIAREDGELMPTELGARAQFLLLEVDFKIKHTEHSGWSLLPAEVKGDKKIWVRLIKPTQFFTGWYHKDVEITDLAFWERPGGWQVACIAIGEKGLPPWEDKPVEMRTE